MQVLAFIVLILSFNTSALAQFSEEEQSFHEYMGTICDSAHFECVFSQSQANDLERLKFRVRQGSDRRVITVTLEDHIEAVRILTANGFRFPTSYKRYTPPALPVGLERPKTARELLDDLDQLGRGRFSRMSAPAETSAMLKERVSDARMLQAACISAGGVCDALASRVAIKTLPALAATFVCTGSLTICAGRLEDYIKDLDKDIETAERIEKEVKKVKPVVTTDNVKVNKAPKGGGGGSARPSGSIIRPSFGGGGTISTSGGKTPYFEYTDVK